jgi:hypothetical protein
MSTPTATVLTITCDDALEALRAVVAEKGEDFSYQPPADGPKGTCVYVWKIDDELQPLCIVGCALARLGIPLGLMADAEFNSINVHALAGRLAQHGYIIEEEAQLLFRSAQIVQDAAMIGKADADCGCESCQEKRDATWGAALRRAEAWASDNAARKAADATAPAPAAAGPAAAGPTDDAVAAAIDAPIAAADAPAEGAGA